MPKRIGCKAAAPGAFQAMLGLGNLFYSYFFYSYQRKPGGR